MSTSRTAYVILGADLFSSEITLPGGVGCVPDGYDEAIKAKGLATVIDGMNGDYYIVGEVLQKGEYDQDDCVGLSRESYELPKLVLNTVNIAYKLEILGVKVSVQHVKLHIFTHWH